MNSTGQPRLDWLVGSHSFSTLPLHRSRETQIWRETITTATNPSDRIALLIVDPYNDFMSDGGKLYEATKKTAQAVGFYDNRRKLIPAIRAARIPVLIVQYHH